MTTLQILAVGLAHLCTPGPQTGWPHAVQDELDARDAAYHAELAAEYGTRAWLEANVARIGAESRLAQHLIDPDDWPSCTACGWNDEDELAPGLNDDLYCGDCRATFAEQDDCRGFTFAYAR